jgi:hypothetical protein
MVAGECPEHTYFLDAEAAYRAALADQRVQEADGGVYPRICYYDGEPYPGALPTMINVPLLRVLEFFGSRFYFHFLPCPTRFHSGREGVAQTAVESSFTEAMREVEIYRRRAAEQLKWRAVPHAHTYFLDRHVAYNVAIRGNRVASDEGWSVDSQQLCYFDGEPFGHGPSNLVHLPAESVLETLVPTRLCLPTRIFCGASIAAEQQDAIETTFKELLAQVQSQRHAAAVQLVGRAVAQPPPSIDGRPLKVLLIASRFTQVMQYASRGLGDALARLGCEVDFRIEGSDRECWTLMHNIMDYVDSGPHLFISINHFTRDWLHPDVFEVSWWQDPMSSLRNGVWVPERARSIVLSAYPDLDDLLHSKGVKQVLRQGFCIDREVFHERPEIPRSPKAVFVGGSYRPRLRSGLTDAERRVLQRIEEMMLSGEGIRRTDLLALAERYGLQKERVLVDFWSYAVREITVRWLCQVPDLEVEVYGRCWEDDPLVRPHFRGELPHGEAVARVYNGACCALVCLPTEVNSQRLAEAAACGCIPVVWDNRATAEPPHWEQECLYFRSREDLHHCLHQRPPNPPHAIAEYASYDALAQRILDLVQERRAA